MAETDKLSEISENKSGKSKENIPKNQPNDNEDADSLDEQPLDIGEHYLVRRAADSWRKFNITLFLSYVYIWIFCYKIKLNVILDPAEIIQTRFSETDNQYEYYVHYEGYNRRLDEWVSYPNCMILCNL